MLPRLLRPVLLAALALAAGAPATHAGDLSLGLKLGGKKGGVSVQFHGGSHGHGYKKSSIVSGRCSQHRRCVPRRVFIPGHYESVERKVWIPGEQRKVFVPPVIETRYDGCGRPFQVVVCEGRWTIQTLPGHYEKRIDRVWVPGRYALKCASY